MANNNFYISDSLFQNETGLFENKKDTTILKGKIFIDELTIVKDELELFEPVYNMTYSDLLYEQKKTITNVSFEELIQRLDSEKIFLEDKHGISKLIRQILIYGKDKKINNKDFVKTETQVFKIGFFIKEGKVIENTLISNLKTSEEDIEKAILMINDIIKDRGEAIDNDCTLLRFMLWSPFSWCIKEIGKSKGLYALILTGSPKTNKTGSCLNFSWLYSTPSDREKAVSTTSVFGSRLEDSTLPAIIDESFNLISREDMQDPMKKCVYDKITRSTKDKSNNKLTDEFKALSLPIFTLNEYHEIKNFMSRRYHINYYPSSMRVSDEKAEEFDIEYSPEYENSPLKCLRHLGRAFADKFIPYIEENPSELFNLEELTVKILKEISEEVGVDFIDGVYNIQKSNDNFNQDKKITIKNGLNKLFRKNHYKYGDSYQPRDFITCADNGEISWLTRKNNGMFVINKSGFEKEVSQIVGETMTYIDILSELSVDTSNKEYKQHHTTKGNIRGFEVSKTELADIFDIHIESW